MRRLGSHRKSRLGAAHRPGTGNSPQNETEIELFDQQSDQKFEQERLVDDAELSRQALSMLTRCVATAAQQTLVAIRDGAEGPETGRLADVAYAFACLEAARHGVLPSTPPPRNS
jgi:hypothetical protein